MSIGLKRVYKPPAASDGTRILVDRLWPRGISKDKASMDLWLKEIAPSGALRKRFHGKPDDWDAFCEAYHSELVGDAAQAAGEELLDRMHSGPAALRRSRPAEAQCRRTKSVARAAQEAAVVMARRDCRKLQA